jgi:hypothetical protein
MGFKVNHGRLTPSPQPQGHQMLDDDEHANTEQRQDEASILSSSTIEPRISGEVRTTDSPPLLLSAPQTNVITNDPGSIKPVMVDLSEPFTQILVPVQTEPATLIDPPATLTAFSVQGSPQHESRSVPAPKSPLLDRTVVIERHRSFENTEIPSANITVSAPPLLVEEDTTPSMVNRSTSPSQDPLLPSRPGSVEASLQVASLQSTSRRVSTGAAPRSLPQPPGKSTPVSRLRATSPESLIRSPSGVIIQRKWTCLWNI